MPKVDHLLRRRGPFGDFWRLKSNAETAHDFWRQNRAILRVQSLYCRMHAKMAILDPLAAKDEAILTL